MRMRYVPGIERGTVRVEHRDRVERVGDGVGEGDRGQIMLGPVRHVLFYYKINRSLFQGSRGSDSTHLLLLKIFWLLWASGLKWCPRAGEEG